MKKILPFLALLGITYTGKTQTITQADHPVAGEIWLQFIDTTGGGVVIDPPGTGLNFDFTNLTIHDTDAVVFEPVSAAPAYMNASTNFPNSGLCVLNLADSSGTFLQSAPDGFYLDGQYSPGLISNAQVGLNIDAISLDPGRLMVPTPFAYSDTRNHTSNFTFSFNPTGIPFPITVTVSSSFVQFMEADGEGTLTTPFGVFPGVLRYKEITYTVDSTFYSVFLNDTVEYSDTTISYSFVKQGPHMMLASVDLDPNTFTPIRASYYDPAVLVGTEQNSITPVLYPNPANEVITLSNVRDNSMLEIFDYTGRVIKQLSNIGMGNRLIMRTEELPSGMYFLRMSEGGKVYNNQKFQVVR
jgi:hypothetical protein